MIEKIEENHQYNIYIVFFINIIYILSYYINFFLVCIMYKITCVLYTRTHAVIGHLLCLYEAICKHGHDVAVHLLRLIFSAAFFLYVRICTWTQYTRMLNTCGCSTDAQYTRILYGYSIHTDALRMYNTRGSSIHADTLRMLNTRGCSTDVQNTRMLNTRGCSIHPDA